VFLLFIPLCGGVAVYFTDGVVSSLGERCFAPTRGELREEPPRLGNTKPPLLRGELRGFTPNSSLLTH